MGFLANINVGNKLVLILLLPLIMLLVFSVTEVMDKNAVKGEMESIETLADLAVNISGLVHVLQSERGLTAGYMGSKGAKGGSEVSSQRGKVDREVDKVEGYLKTVDLSGFDKTMTGTLSEGMSAVRSISGRRDAATSLTATGADIFGYYTRMIDSYLNTIALMATISTDAKVTARIVSYETFLHAKEFAGQERGFMNGVFARGSFGDGEIQTFTAKVTAQDVFLEIFEQLAADEQVDFYDGKMRAGAVGDATAMREAAFASAGEASLGIEARTWFGAMTGKINLMKDVEDRLAEDFKGLAAELGGAAGNALMRSITMTAIAVIGSLLLAYFISKSITGPIGTLNISMEELASGEGDLTARLDIKGTDEVATAANAFNRFIEGLHSIMKDVNSNAVQLSSAAEEISSATEQLAGGADAQHKQASETASAMEEMASSVQLVYENSKKSIDASERAASQAEDGGKVVQSTMAGMSKIEASVQESAAKIAELGTKSQEIGKIVNVINEIAAQTNLLALNAAIEAARAGEHGRGFEVVAEEIRKLAEQSAKSTIQITGIIEEIQGETSRAAESMSSVTKEVEEGTKLSDETGESLTKIIESISETAEMIRTMADASKQQASVSDQVATSVENISTITKESASSSEEMARTAQELAKMADGMRKLVNQFKL